MNNIRSDHGRAVRRPVSSTAAQRAAIAPCPAVAPVPQPTACSAARAEDDNAVLPVMAYVPIQSFGQVYSDCQALHSGTLFPALDKPFTGKGCH